MQLKVFKRTVFSKSESKRIRREGNIPAVLYVKGQTADPIIVTGTEYEEIMRSLQPGRISTTVFSLVEDGKERRAILKEIQYEPTTYKVRHLDFEELIENSKVNVKVPIELIGVVDCVGAKLGGILRPIIRYLKVRCLPKDIPSALYMNVKDMGQNESKRLGDLDIPPTIRPLANLNEVAVVIAKR